MTTESLSVVARYDEAIDYESMSDEEQRRYIETRDISLLKAMPGEKPAVFHVRRLRTSEMRNVNAQPNEKLGWEVAFRIALVRGDDIRFTDGSRGAYVRPSDKMLNDGQLDRFAPADVIEVGSFIVEWSNLGKGRPAVWQLPATSERALAALGSLRAAQKRASAASPRQSSEPAAEAVGAAPPSSPGGATSGAATATG